MTTESESNTAPLREYEERLETRRTEWSSAARRQSVLSTVRLAGFFVGALFLWWVYRSPSLSWPWALLPILGFAVLVVLHERAARASLRAERGVRYYRRGLDRLSFSFAGTGKTGDAYAHAEHTYAPHLDLFGRGSLFELLCNAQTSLGEERLASWLLRPAAIAELRERQAAVTELRPLLDLREDLAVLGPAVERGVSAPHLLEWGSVEHGVQPRTRWLAFALAMTTVVSATVAALSDAVGMLPLIAALVAQSIFAWRWRRYVREIQQDCDRSARELHLLGELLGRLEREKFQSPRLATLQARLQVEGRPPSAQIARLRRLMELLDARRNQVFTLLTPLVLWTTQVCFAIAQWRKECGPMVPEWLDVVAEVEALCDLATYAYERPDDPFPELAETGQLVEGEGLGHPLIAADRRVPNDITIGPELALYVVSGSNMSGKSTWLRTIGINVVLALTGAPVCAARLRVRPLALGASIRVQDSLQHGKSRFYAELDCLRRILSLTDEPLPVLFLLDEILAGTNSHDRRIGAAALVRQLLDRRAVGLLTTHDLSLADIVGEVGERARNVHFADQFEDGEMSFDYQLQRGVVQKSNALELMRSVWLKL